MSLQNESKPHVRYNKLLNQIECGQLSAVEQNLFFYICARIREHNDALVNISFKSIRKNTGFTGCGNKSLVDKLIEMNRSLLQLNYQCVINDGKTIIQGSLFTLFVTEIETETLSVCVNPNSLFLFNNLDVNFTDWELKEFMQIKSVYSKRLYRLVKEWKTMGETPYYDITELRTRLGVPEKYPNYKFMSKIFKPACEDMKTYFCDFEYEDFRCSKKGLPIASFMFTFTPGIHNYGYSHH